MKFLYCLSRITQEKFDNFTFVYVLNMRDDLLCLPFIMEISVNCYGKVMEF